MTKSLVFGQCLSPKNQLYSCMRLDINASPAKNNESRKKKMCCWSWSFVVFRAFVPGRPNYHSNRSNLREALGAFSDSFGGVCFSNHK